MNDLALADANVLVAFAVSSHVHHAAARAWIAAVPAFATTPITESALVRALINPAIVRDTRNNQLSIADALDVLRRIRLLPNARFLPDGTSLADARALTAQITGHRQVTDAQLLNLAIANGATLATFDAGIPSSLKPRDRRHVRLLT
ncbi:MAG: PIN domain-containing protein [Micropruina sp.]|uniref:TA system VapC family ribonuclease toxin n=1 Tax=Micropruina sp. TaxID=2737536 RepID=UPI0039E265B6